MPAAPPDPARPAVIEENRLTQPVSRTVRGLITLALVLCAGLTACTPAAQQPPSSASPTTAGGSSSGSATPAAVTTASSRADTLPAGFPAQLIPAMPGMQSVAGTVNTHGDATDVGFSGTVTADPAAVDAFYGSRFTAQGFKAPDPVTVAGVLTRTYVRNNGEETISLSAAPVNGGTTVTIGATVRAGSAK